MCKHSASTATATTPTTPGDHQQSSPVTAAEANLCSTVAKPLEVSIQTSESDIDSEIQELESLFLNIVSEAAEDLTTIKLSKVKCCVTQLPVSVKYQHLCFLRQYRSAISNAKSVDEILAILGEYWDFLNCGLLDEVVRQLGNDATKQLMKQYMKKLTEFRMKTKLGDFFWQGYTEYPPSLHHIRLRARRRLGGTHSGRSGPIPKGTRTFHVFEGVCNALQVCRNRLCSNHLGFP